VVRTEFPNQTPITVTDPARTGMTANQPIRVAPLPLDHRKVIARRAALELRAGQLVNLGVGMANGVSYVALEEGVLDEITMTVEQGLFGGLPAIGLDSGTALNPAAIIDMSSQFDLYDGGGLDLAGLSFAQIDAAGNVNVARVGSKPIGPGGFIDISQKARGVVFCGTFRGGGLETVVRDGRIEILQEGRYGKFVRQVDAISYSAERAIAERRTAVFVTERAVFRLGPDGLELIEIAPGIDLDRDVLAHMPFHPVIRDAPRTMDARVFAPEPMGLRLPPSVARRNGRTSAR
jgi:propionate CoA-transferase